MAKQDDEDSVLFSLNELKRVGSTPSKASEAAPTPSRGASKATDPDDDHAHALLQASLSTLRQSVEDKRRREEELRRDQEEERRLIEEDERLARELAARESELSQLRAQRESAAERVRRARAEGRRAEDADLALVGVGQESERPKGFILSPVAAIVLGLVFVVGLGGLGAYAFMRAPEVRTVSVPTLATKDAATAQPPALGLDFGAEIGWLAVNDVAAAPAAAEEEEEDRPRRARARRRAAAVDDSEAAAPSKASKKRVVLPPKPTGNGFVY